MQDLISKAARCWKHCLIFKNSAARPSSSNTAAASWIRRTRACANGVARDIVFLEAVEINPVVVHGGGKAITRAMEKAGLKANFIQGQRVTDEATVQIVDHVLSREINPEVVASINSLGGMAKALPGRTFLTAARSSAFAGRPAARHRLRGRSDRGEHRAAAGMHRTGHHPGDQPHRPRRRRQHLQLQRRRGRRPGRYRAPGQAPGLHERRARPVGEPQEPGQRHLPPQNLRRWINSRRQALSTKA